LIKKFGKMIIFSFLILVLSSALILINLLLADSFYKKVISYFYFSTNVAILLISSFLYYRMFGFVIYTGILLLFVNMVLILIMVYNRKKGEK